MNNLEEYRQKYSKPFSPYALNCFYYVDAEELEDLEEFEYDCLHCENCKNN